MPKLPHPKERKIQFISIAWTLFLLMGLLTSLNLIEIEQDLRQQAMIGRQDIDDSLIIEDTQELGDLAAGKLARIENNLKEFTSEKNRYQVQFDSNIWTAESMLPSISDDEDPSYFTHQSMQGFISVYFNSQNLSQIGIEFEDLDDLAQQLEQRFISRRFSNYRGQTVTYQGYELVNIGGRNAIKFDYLSNVLGQSVPYSEYVFAVGDILVEAEVKTAGFLNSESLLNHFFQGMTFSSAEQSSQKSAVKGAQIFRNPASQTQMQAFNEPQLVVLNDPSVVEIITLYCKDLKVDNAGTSFIKDNYQYCGAMTGSGFMVEEQGVVATNAHVVQTHPEMDIIGGFLTGNVAVYDLLIDMIIEEFHSDGISITQAEAKTVLSQIIQDPAAIDATIVVLYELFEEEAIEVVDANSLTYVNVGRQAFEFNPDFEKLSSDNLDRVIKANPTILKAELIDSDYYNPLAKEVILGDEHPEGSDIALIKLQNNQNYKFPSLVLNQDQAISAGDRILVISFPGLVSGRGESSSFLIDYRSSGSKATVTTGIVSSLKTDKAGNRLVQTDASFSAGSSGAPAINYKGEVIGIATYGLSDDQSNYNFLIDVDSLLKLAENNNINLSQQPSNTYYSWRQGLDLFWNSRYSRSLELLSSVENRYPIHPTVGDYVVRAETAIESGQDVDLLFGMNRQYVYLGLAGLGLLLLITLVFHTMKLIREKGDQNMYPQKVRENNS